MRRPNLTPSDTVTSITPPSFVDDGLNLSRRMPRAEHRDVNSWLEGAQASVAPPVVSPTSAASETIYTGSFIDDGADMVYPSVPIVPGCGIVDRAFYSKGKWRTSKYDAEWTIEKEKALAGDMWRSLARMRSIARVEVKDAGEAHRREEKKRRKEHRVGAVENDGRVRIPKPLTWGTFVIEGSDGRVVVVDKEADYDSGRPGEREEMGAREREYEERIGKRKAKDAARREKESDKEVKVRAAVEARERREREEEEKARAQAASGDQQRKDEHRRHRCRQPSSRLLAPIPEAHTPEESVTDIVSPTKFFMTGVEEISDHSTAGSNGSNSRGPSLIRSDDRGSDGELVAEHDEDTRSVRSHSTYRAPTVEDAPESEDGAQEWNSAWSVKDSRGHGHNAEDGGSQAGVEASVAGSARWSGKTGWGGDVETPGSVAEGAKWDGSAAGSRVESDWKDQSGYAEENDTWLNSEVRGVKYREAEWRKDAIEGSWRDVW
ncbi:uncharacterized protein CC84DRAFT_1260066 [Paraphaeosphaeria sporulosa]|uniref:Uncharacterized protein n=1 Tax=Paraphaeosphaeria sporulosa TaxID=1460663 RepID=A0A177CAH0_9PLEO|nr:uncharacterized protein CC84DRAFT_1260066 [Paraphaeosphaeria sporulosa]OAG04744.1 hypothetical protein CC84DRAFT_1260066 [Paraphaeosphaeria sporulosa]